MDNVVSSISPMQANYLKEGAVLLIDKPLEWTSFDVVNKIRYAIRGRLQVKKYKVGHAGTLDPLASGLLILCIGPYTKKIDEIVAYEKGYTGEISLGACTASYDAELLPDIYYPYKEVTKTMLDQVIDKFTGDIEQLPPMYSAIKVKGQKLYELARRGKSVELKRRPITIFDLEIEHHKEAHKLDIGVSCSKGTYIRSLAKDIGEELGVGGYLSVLRRTAIGAYDVTHAVTIEEIVEQINTLDISSILQEQ